MKLTRKVAEYTEYVDGRSGRFPVAAKLIEAAASRDKFDPTSEADPDDDSCEHGMSPAYACSECRNQ